MPPGHVPEEPLVTVRRTRPSAAEPGHRDGRRPGPARPRGQVAGRAPRPGHRRAGRPRPARRWWSGAGSGRSPAARATTRSSGPRLAASWTASTCPGPSARSARSACTSSSSTSPRSGTGSGPCASASGRPAPAILDDSVAEAVAPDLAHWPRPSGRIVALIGRLADHAGPDRPSDRGPAPDAARRASPRATGSSSDSMTAASRPTEDRDLRRRLREEITLLWRTADLRSVAPSPLDEVRTALDVLRRNPVHGRARGSTAPSTRPRSSARPSAGARPGRAGRRGGRSATDSGRTGTRPPRSAFLRWGSLDRRRPRRQPPSPRRSTERPCASTPTTSCTATRRSRRACADRSLRPSRPTRPGAARATRLARDARPPAGARSPAPRRFPDEPYRQRFGSIAERLRRTRAFLTGQPAPLTGRYPVPDELDCRARRAPGRAGRRRPRAVAWGEVQDFRWQVETFGFHLAALEVRQHSAVHAGALAALRRRDLDAERSRRASAPAEVAGDVPGHRRGPGRFGARPRGATSSASRRAPPTSRRPRAGLAGTADRGRGHRRLARPTRLDVVPLFEDAADALEAAGRSSTSCSADPALPRPPRSPGRPPGGDARLLRFEQGVRLPGRQLAAPSGAGGARGDRPARTASS